MTEKSNIKLNNLVSLSKEDLRSMCNRYLNSEDNDIEKLLSEYILLTRINKNLTIEMEVLKNELSLSYDEVKILKDASKALHNKLEHINLVQFQQVASKLDDNLDRQKKYQSDITTQKEEIDLLKTKIQSLEDENNLLKKENLDLNKKQSKRKKAVLTVHKNNLMVTMQKTLISPDFDIITSKDGEDAKSLFLEKSPDIVITEIDIPSLSGLDLSKWIKNNSKDKNIPVILIVSQKEGIEERLEVSLADSFLVKGQFDKKTLNEIINKYTSIDDI